MEGMDSVAEGKLVASTEGSTERMAAETAGVVEKVTMLQCPISTHLSSILGRLSLAAEDSLTSKFLFIPDHAKLSLNIQCLEIL